MKGAERTVTQRAQMKRANQLGSTPVTTLVRCLCGRRNYFDRRAWTWLGVAFCLRCWQAILHHDLKVVSRWEGERMLKEQMLYEGELKALRTVEAVMRRFLVEFHANPLWMWPSQIVRMAQAVQVNLHLAELARARQGAQPTVLLDETLAAVAASMEADDTPDDGMTSDDELLREELTSGELPGGVYELTTDEAMLLDAYSRLPADRRAVMLAFVEQEGRSAAAGMAGMEGRES